MATKTYLKRIRHDLLPKITDWTSSHPEIRYQYDVKKLSYSEWFWLHPSAYKLIYWGIPVCLLVNAAILILLGTMWNNSYLYTPGYIFGFLAFLVFLIKYKNRKMISHMTMYDIYLKDDIIEVK